MLAGYVIHKTASAGKGTLRIIEKTVDWPEKIARGFSQLFHTSTVIQGTSISLPGEGILELNLIQRQIQCITLQENSFMGSKAVRIIKGVYTAKAGYDLSEGLQMSFDETTKTLFIKLPKPKITSLEGVPETFYLDGGVFKWGPNTEEIDEGNRKNREQAMREAANSLTAEAEQRMKERIRDIFSPFVAQVIFASANSETPELLLNTTPSNIPRDGSQTGEPH